jgi:LPS sulfotransferase NodH
MLKSTGKVGDPHSFFREENIADWAEGWNLDEGGLPGTDVPSKDYLARAIESGRNGSSVFGLRLMHESLKGLLDYLRAISPPATSDRADLESAFGPLLYIHLQRDDSLGQAISLLRAEQTGLWHKAPDGSDIERLPSTRAAGCDFKAIQNYVGNFEAQKAAWTTWFEEQRISPLSVSYDDLTANPQSVLLEVCKALDVDISEIGHIETPTAKLRDSTNAEWTRMYLDDLAGQ